MVHDLPGKSHYSYKTEVCIVWIFLKGRPLAGYNHTYNLLLGHFSVGTNDTDPLEQSTVLENSIISYLPKCSSTHYSLVVQTSSLCTFSVYMTTAPEHITSMEVSENTSNGSNHKC